MFFCFRRFMWNVAEPIGPAAHTPLHLAAVLDDTGLTAGLLLQSCPEAPALWTSAKDAQGLTPAQLLHRCAHSPCVAVLMLCSHWNTSKYDSCELQTYFILISLLLAIHIRQHERNVSKQDQTQQTKDSSIMLLTCSLQIITHIFQCANL